MIEQAVDFHRDGDLVYVGSVGGARLHYYQTLFHLFWVLGSGLDLVVLDDWLTVKFLVAIDYEAALLLNQA